MQFKEEALFTLKMDGKPILNELGEVEKKLADLNAAQKEVTRGTKEWAANKAEIKALEEQIVKVRNELGVSGLNVQQLGAYYKQLQKEILLLTPGTEAYIAKAAQLREVDGVLREHKTNVRAVSEEIEKQPSLWDRVKESAAGYLAAFSATALLEQAFNFMAGGIQKALQLSDVMGGVAKATGESAEQVAELSAEIDKIDTRTTKESLMEIAQIGGQLGVANDELLGFIQSTDMAAVALSDEFVGGAEEAANKLGGLQKLFKETKDLKAGEAINQIGSALNDLGASGSATAPVVADFTARMGQLGNLSPQITQTLGLGAAFQELGLSADIGASGLSNILNTAAVSTGLFAQQLGISEKEMQKLINTNPNEFLLKLADSLKDVPADQLAKRMKELGVNSDEARKVMSLLKDQTDLVREKQELANKSFAAGTSLQNEFNIMNNTAAAQYEKSQKALALIATEIGQFLLPVVVQVTQGVITFVNVLRGIPDFISENKTGFYALGIAVLAFNKELIVATATSLANTAAEKARAIASAVAEAADKARATAAARKALAEQAATVATTEATGAENVAAASSERLTLAQRLQGVQSTVLSGLKTVQTVATNALTVAQGFLNAAFTANPIGVVITAIGILVALFVTAYNNSSTLRGVISGTWEAIKAGVSIVGDITSKIGEWVQKGLEPLRPLLDVVGSALAKVWDVLAAGVGFVANLNQAWVNFMGAGIGRVSTALEPVRAALASFWALIETGITKIKSIGSAISTFLHVDDIVAKTKAAASQIGDAFNKGYGDKLAEDRPKQTAAHQQHLDTKKGAETKTANELVTVVTAAEQKALDKKAAQNDKHRDTEARKATDAAKKQADESVKANNDALKAIETERIAAIKSDLDRNIATIRAKRDAEVEAAMASKASAEVKAVWEQALNEKMIRDIAAAREKERVKTEKEEGEAAKRTLELKIKLAGDEKADKLQKLEDVASAQRAQVAKDVQDETQKAALLKQINDNLIAQKEKVEQEYRRKNEAETKALLDAQYQATLADTDNRLLLARDNAGKIYDAKKDRLEAEYQYNKAKLTREAAEEKAKNQDLIQDKERRAQADKATDDKLKAQLSANDIKYETDKTALTEEKTATRRKNQEEFFSAVKGMMNGDFTTFSDLLTKKLTGEKKQLTDSQKANVDKIDKVGGYAVAGVQALMALNTAALNKELGNISKERTTQLATWKDKYDKGLINKDQYEKGVDSINKEADQKTKAAQLAAFKRQQALDIVMAVINGVQAALKSLAMFGWPFGLIGAAGAAVAAGIQIAMIKRQQPPSMARGGTIKNGGVPEGPRHGSRYGESGLSITRRDTGEEVAEMEGGEPVMVLSRNTYHNNRRVVDSLMHSSLHRNGAAVMQRGGILLEDGGYTQSDQSDSIYSSSRSEATTESGGGNSAPADAPADSGSGGGSDWMNQANNTADELDSSSYQAEVDKSTALMEAIGKNTLATVDGLTRLMDLVARQDAAQNSAFTALANTLSLAIARLGDDFRTALPTLGTEIGSELAVTNSILRILDDQASSAMAQADAHQLGLIGAMGQLFATLDTTIKGWGLSEHLDLMDLKQTAQTDLTALRADLLQQATALHVDLIGLGLTVHLDLMDVKQTSHTDLGSLQQSIHADMVDSQSGLGQQLASLRAELIRQNAALHVDLIGLGLSVHLDLMDVKQTSHTDLTALQTGLHADLIDLERILDLDLTALKNAVHADLFSAQKATDTQLTTLRTETKNNFTSLRNTVQQVTEALQKALHSDLGAVQGLLGTVNAEQRGQTGLLGAIAAKDLSVQTFVNVFNQIDVVMDSSKMK